MIFSLRSIFLIALVGMLICGCSGKSSQPITPDTPESSPGITYDNSLAVNSTGGGHRLLNYGFIYINPDEGVVDLIPVRAGEFHLNILKLLEVGPCTDCFRIVGFNFPQPDLLDLDVRIDHPFDFLDLSVFDVRAILMFNGSHEYPSMGKLMSDPELGDGAVLNPDGYTALYNGSTIGAPVGDYLKYFPGNLSTLDIPNSDINGFRYFITDDPDNDRNAFYAGSSDVETFSLKLPTGPFVVGYAVDASWEEPKESPVDDPLEDFSYHANCIEPWKIEVSEQKICDGLTEIGGETNIIINVHSWQSLLYINYPVIECPDLFDGTISTNHIISGSEPGFYQFMATITNDKLALPGIYKCLIWAECKENNPEETPWLDLSAYQIFEVEVIEEQPAGPGHIMWAESAGGEEKDQCYGITSLSDDSTVVCGSFSKSTTFGDGELNETVLISSGGLDIFVARYNLDGTLLWAKHAGGKSYEHVYSITSLSDNSTVVTGSFEGYATFGEGEQNETILKSGGYSDIFVARYNPDGTLVWAKRAGGKNPCYGKAITSLSDDSSVVTGYFYSDTGPATFGAGEINETILTSSGSSDAFIARYNSDGSLAWAKRAGGVDADGGNAITCLSDDSTVITGNFRSWAIFGSGEPDETILLSNGTVDIFVAQFNPDGSLSWAKSAGGASINDISHGISALSDDSTVITGFFSQEIIFGKGEPSETTLADSGVNDIFIARYSGDDGSLIWAKRAGGNNQEESFGITTLQDDSIVITGDFQYESIFGQGEPNEIFLDGNGNWDIFLARYNSDGSLFWAKQAGGPQGGDGGECGRSITTLSDDSIVVTGGFWDTAIFGVCDPINVILTSAGKEDIFIARFAP